MSDCLCNKVDGCQSNKDYIIIIPDEEEKLNFQVNWGDILGDIKNQVDLYTLAIRYITEKDPNITTVKQALDKLFEKAELAGITGVNWGDIQGELLNQSDLYTEAIEYQNESYPLLKTVKDAIDMLLHKALSVSLSGNLISSNGIYTGVNFSWRFNKTVTTQTFDGNTVTGNSATIQPITKLSYSVSGSDGKETASASWSIPKYFCTASSKTSYDEIVKQATTSNTVNALSGEYIYVFSPVDLRFFVGGFEGGFELIKSDYQLKKFSGLTLNNYRIYRSDNSGLGNTTVTWQLR